MKPQRMEYFAKWGDFGIEMEKKNFHQLMKILLLYKILQIHNNCLPISIAGLKPPFLHDGHNLSIDIHITCRSDQRC